MVWKNILMFFTCFINAFAYSQTIPVGAVYIKTIESKEYKKKVVINERTLRTYYDSDWNKLKNTNTLASALDNGAKSVTLIDTPEKQVTAEITSKGARHNMHYS